MLPEPIHSRVASAYEGYALDIQRVDISKLLILYLFGGIYCDVDLVALRHVKPLLAQNSFYICREREPFFSLCNAFIASTRGHELTAFLIEFLCSIASLQAAYEGRPVAMTLNTTGPRAITKGVLCSGVVKKDVCLDLDYRKLYPIPWRPFDSDSTTHTQDLRARYPLSYAVHLWTGAWRPENVPK